MVSPAAEILDFLYEMFGWSGGEWLVNMREVRV